MKNLFLILAVSTTILFTSCEGPQGPPGDIYLGQVFERTVNYTYNNEFNEFSTLITFPSNVIVYEADVVLVYLLEDVIPDGNGGTIDIWSQLPQTFFLNEGILDYGFDHTFLDVKIILRGNFDLWEVLGSEFTNNQTVRIAILPAEYANTNLTMEELMSSLQIDTSTIEVMPN